MPSVLPCSSYSFFVIQSLPRQAPEETYSVLPHQLRATASMSMIACSATATELAPPLLQIGTPARLAASTLQRS